MYLNKSIAFLILCFLQLSINAQFVDNFSNATLNAKWQGQTTLFTVSGGKLTSNGPNASSQSIYLTAGNVSVGNYEWQFLLDLKFAPSSTNLFRFYLSSTNDILTSSLSGYYIEIGESNQDRINVFRQIGNSRIKIFTSTGVCFSSTTANYSNVRVKTTRDADGNWTVFSDCLGGNNFSNQGSFTDSSLPISTLFGINCVYATASRYNLYNIDDIYVGNIQVDNTPPSVVGINVLATNQLKIDFSEPILSSTGTILSNYMVNNGLGNPTSALATFSSSVVLGFVNNFSANNTITILGISDLSGNILNSVSIDFAYNTTVPSSNTTTPKNYRDVVINELMADVNPAPDGIPPYEYLELYNNTNQTLNLFGDTLIDGNTKRPFTRNLTISGGGFVVLVNSLAAQQDLLAAFPSITIYTLSGLGLTDGGETFTLKNAGGTIIDKVSYKTSWYKDASKSSGGFSLEQINPNNPCSDQSNWKASSDPNGGTPGAQNSVLSNMSNIPKVNSLVAKSVNQIEIVFNQPMDTTSFDAGNFAIESSIATSINRYSQDTLSLIIASNLQLGKPYLFTIAGVKNCEGTVIKDSVFTIGLPRMPKAGEVIINEVMAEPEPQVQLPIAEFVELYNTTDDLIDLSNFKLKDATATSNGKVAPNTVILPKNYLVLTSESNANLFGEDVKIGKVTGFPSLNKTGDLISISDLNSSIIDQINYKPDWYRDELKADGGWTLERINPIKNCGGKYNWTASTSSNGGTPGKVNSVTSVTSDVSKPLITNVLINSIATIKVVFNEGIDTLNLKSAFSISGLNIGGVSLSSPNADTAFINLNNLITLGKSYSIRVQNLYDCATNKIDFYEQSIGIGRKPLPYEVVITEIMADETPVLQLPEAEFVELYNTTNDLIDLGDFKLYDATTIPGKFPSTAIIKPKGYLILCSTSKLNDFKPFGDSYGISSFPSLNATSDFLRLVSPENITISKVNYQDSWYRDELKIEGGWTLEQIDPSNPCGTGNNWLASSDSKGGTPGRVNSNFASNPDNSPPKLIQAFATAEDTLVLTFDEPIDSISAAKALYAISNSIEANVSTIETDKVYLTLVPKLLSNQVYKITITQLQDCVGNFIEVDNSKTFVVTEKAEAADVVINEVLFNPRTGGSDFVEIYNRSNKNINLKNWQLANVQNDTVKNFRLITEENLLLQPHSYKTLTDNSANIKNNYPNAIDSAFIPMQGLPAYNDDEGTVVLVNSNKETLDLFHYSDDFHLKLIDNKEGISLERVNINLPTNTPENWASASQNVGFATPGYQNSQQSNFVISDKTVDITPKVFSPDQDGYLDFTTITFNNTTQNFIANIIIYDLEGRAIRRLVKNQNIGSQNFFQWDGLDDAGKKSPVGNYLVYIEIFNLNGESKRFKENVVLAARF